MRLGLLAAAWLAGTYIGLRTDSPTLPLLLLFLAVLAGGPLLRLYRLSLWPVVLAAVLLLALLRVETADQPLTELTSEDEQPVTLRGRISDDPEATSQRIKFTLAVEAIDRGNGLEPIEATVLAYAEPPDFLVSLREAPFFRYNDMLLIEGRLQRPKQLADFDYPSYLANQGISGVVFARKTPVLDPAGGTKGGWRGRIFDLRGKLSESIVDALSVPQSAVAKALLLGQRGQLPDHLVQDFRDTGTSHLLAISGLHVGALMAIAMAVAVGVMGPLGDISAVAVVAHLAVCPGKRPASIGVAGGDHGQRVFGCPGAGPPSQCAAGTGIERCRHGRIRSQGDSAGLLPTQLCRNGGHCSGIAVPYLVFTSHRPQQRHTPQLDDSLARPPIELDGRRPHRINSGDLGNMASGGLEL